MRLILKDYIETFKEEKEMEKLLDNILVMNDYSNIIRPQKGVTQHGVDFSAVKDKEIYLFVLKQKDIDKSNWDTGNNAVRPTLNEILDTYIPQRLNDCDKKINIIVCTNGVIKQNVEASWNGFVNNNSTKRIKFNFWGIDDLVIFTEQFLLNEYIFEDELKSDLRKTLYFYEEDTNLKYYNELLKKLIDKIDIKNKKSKNYKKSIIVYILIAKMCIKYAYQKNKKTAVNMAERALVIYWNFIFSNSLFEKKDEIELLNSICSEYQYCCKEYINEIKKIYQYKPGFPIYNSIEYRIAIYEAIGIIATYTYYIFYYRGKTNEVKENINLLITLINNNASFFYPIYDLNAIEINILIFLLKEVGNNQVDILVEALMAKIFSRMNISKYYPVEYENFDKVLDIEFNDDVETCSASILLSNLLEWLIVIGKTDIFKNAYGAIIKKFPNISFNSIEIDLKCEIEYFNYNTDEAIITYIVDFNQDIQSIENEMKQIYENYKLENYKFYEYCAAPFLFITSRNMRLPLPSNIIYKYL